ncbi:EamA family transporter|uniref:EamA-like transporter family protein n=1 Tax=Dendrosporobacter quercicolus TaxID=146817 RepID=A0A1G9XQ77_9FIRM|nr:EamA family transporter [Dendrosporobacter quercicolus]NSL49116.1 EamA family transporter [Dendrosporobacter quercicolus DSM 1736]SDM98972.1 EamA-like transporter family protein [Dendrosporobacter quercicolus]
MFYYLTMTLTILANLFYHILQKSISPVIHPLFSLLVTYVTAIVVVLIVYPFYPSSFSFYDNLKGLNWASAALALAIIGLELGFLLAYRAGWDISLAAIISNVSVSVLLIPIGILLFKETITAVNTVGLLFCIIGIILTSSKS